MPFSSEVDPKMSVQKLLADFQKAFFDDDSEAVRQILFNTPEILRLPVESPFIDEVLFLAHTLKKHDKIKEHLDSFMKIGAERDLKKQLVSAVLERNFEAAESLLKNGAKFKVNICKFVPAIYTGVFCNKSSRKNMLTLLLKNGLGVEYRNQHSQNVLIQFINYFVGVDDNDAVEIAEILLNSGISIHDKCNKGLTPIYYATGVDNHRLVQFFIDKGDDVDRRSLDDGSFPLLVAITADNDVMVDLLLSNGADVNNKDSNGDTALHMACHTCSKKIMSRLIEKGAAICARNENGETPFTLLIFSPENDEFDECRILMIKEFAKLIFEDGEISKEDMILIKENPGCRKHFDECMTELEKMSKTKFYGPYSYYSVLRKKLKNPKKAHLTNNENFVSKFVENLPQFSYFRDELRTNLEDSIQVKERLEFCRARLKVIFGDSLPNVVLGKLSENLTLEDLPL